MENIVKIISNSLNISEPNYIGDIVIDEEHKEIDIIIETKLKKECCPNCQKITKIHDRLNKKWRHINALDYKVFVSYKTPRVKCLTHGVKLVDVEWAKPRHHFTKEMEQYIYQLSKTIPLKYIGDMVGEHDTRIRRIVKGVENEKNK